MVTDWSNQEDWNARSSIVVTESWIVTNCKFSHSENDL